MPHIERAGARIYYETYGHKVGTAPAMVFAHGAGGNHLSWWQQVPHFRGRYSCVVFDHRGWGLSVGSKEQTAVESKEQTAKSKDEEGGQTAGGGPDGSQFVEDLRALLDHLEIERATLVAQSMGGWTSLGFAMRWPERVERLVMCDTHGGIDTPEIRAAWSQARELAASLPPGAHPACGARMFREQPEMHFLYTEINDLTPPRTPDEMRALIRDAGTLSPADVASLDMPALFIAGEEDIVIPPAVIEIASGYIRDAAIERVPEAGHSVYFERPSRFNEVVDEFLSRSVNL